MYLCVYIYYNYLYLYLYLYDVGRPLSKDRSLHLYRPLYPHDLVSLELTNWGVKRVVLLFPVSDIKGIV